MSTPEDCAQNTDPLKLVREGTSQDGRRPAALDPAYAPVNEHSVRHGIVFAQSYAALLKYVGADDVPAGDWTTFFGSDLSVPLAVAAIEDVDAYKANLQGWFDYQNDLQNESKSAELRDRLGYLYASIATLAQAVDGLKAGLPPEDPLKGTLRNLIRTQLAPAFKRLIAYYKAGIAFTPPLINAIAPATQILRRPVVPFDAVLATGLSSDWSDPQAWGPYVAGIAADASVYGASASTFAQINHCATHNLFRSVFDQFLRVFARIVGAAQDALDDSLTKWDEHEPHYALYLAFLHLLENARAAGNALTERHLNFYYRKILGLKEKPAEPAHVHLLAELAKQVASRDFKPGELFKAGKDDQGKDVVFANLGDLVANRATVAALKTVYRHGNEPVASGALHEGRIFASPAADSDDGLDAPLTTVDQSWHPFFNKLYTDGALAEIRMPKADIGFAIASHYLLLAEGSRDIYVGLSVAGYTGPVAGVDFKNDIRCFLTTEKGWLEKTASQFAPTAADKFLLKIDVSGADAPIVPYSAKAHGYAFQTDLPMLLVTLKQDDTRPYAYPAFQDVSVTEIGIGVVATYIKSLAVSNDLGPVDTSKPFQPFGPSPAKGSSLIIGSKEIFQKALTAIWIRLDGLVAPVYPPNAALPTVGIDFLSEGQWVQTYVQDSLSSPLGPFVSVGAGPFLVYIALDKPVLDQPDFSPNESYSTKSRQGFLRLSLTDDFGQAAYQSDLVKYLRKDSAVPNYPGQPPLGPTASALSMDYIADATLVLSSSAADSYERRSVRFFHLTPFGAAEQHPYLNGGATVALFPPFEFVPDNAPLLSEAEFYVGIAGLAPPQSLALLFQVADGTANPVAEKPKPHIDWSYLSKNRWTSFGKTDVQDGTDALLHSGIIRFAVPCDATDSGTMMPPGLFWIRAAVHEKSDAVCRLQRVAAQAMEAVFVDRGNSPRFSATPLPAGTISKLDKPDAAVKAVSQPFPSFGGRGAEQSQAFYTRISERLRHKDRAIDLWDYERLILEAFPQIYKVKCLNHTRFEPNESGTGIYRELAPGHVTVVAIPRIQAQKLRDPLKPFASLAVLEDIEAFLARRTSCFARLHVKNPQFEDVRVRFAVRFYDGFDESHYTNVLKQAITRFLSPWAFSDGGSPSFGGRVHKSVLVDFVEDQPYVDYVTDFQLFQDIGGQASADLDEVKGSTAVSILVSAPASKHEISILKPAPGARLGESCPCDA